MIPRKHQYDWASLTDADKLRMFSSFKFVVEDMAKKHVDSLARYPDGYFVKMVGKWLDDVDHGFYECSVAHKREELAEAQQTKIKEF